jgi:hypothetical protein
VRRLFAEAAGPELCARLLFRAAPEAARWILSVAAALDRSRPPALEQAALWAALLAEVLGPARPSAAGLARHVVRALPPGPDRAAVVRDWMARVVGETGQPVPAGDPHGSSSPVAMAPRSGGPPAAAGGDQRPAEDSADMAKAPADTAHEGRALPDPLSSATALLPGLLAAFRPFGSGHGRETEAFLLPTDAAGLVLVAPHLGALFARLGASQDWRLATPEGAARALDLMHAVLHGTTEAPAGARPLERLLLGLPEEMELPPPRPLEAADAAVVDGMLGAVIGQWGALGQTSVTGLREAFLRRDGLLGPSDAGWQLDVTPRAYDMLLDRLPWSIGVVKLRWMIAPIIVKWRNS